MVCARQFMVTTFLLVIGLGFHRDALTQISDNWSSEQKEWLNRQKKLYLMSTQEVDTLLSQLHSLFPDFQDRLRALSYLRLNTPYDLKALGQGWGYEPNPVFRLDKTNCTVQVLTNSALAHARSYAQAESLMAFINYYPGENPIRYANRRHYTSDRILTSDYFEELTSKIARPEELDSVHLILNQQKDGSHFLPVDWEKEVTLPYIPRKFITRDLLGRLPAVCGVGIVRKSLFDKGIIIGHEGMVFDGRIFVHASSQAGKVICEDFLKYCTHRPCDGVVFYLFREVHSKSF